MMMVMIIITMMILLLLILLLIMMMMMMLIIIIVITIIIIITIIAVYIYILIRLTGMLTPVFDFTQSTTGLPGSFDVCGQWALRYVQSTTLLFAFTVQMVAYVYPEEDRKRTRRKTPATGSLENGYAISGLKIPPPLTSLEPIATRSSKSNILYSQKKSKTEMTASVQGKKTN